MLNNMTYLSNFDYWLRSKSSSINLMNLMTYNSSSVYLDGDLNSDLLCLNEIGVTACFIL